MPVLFSVSQSTSDSSEAAEEKEIEEFRALLSAAVSDVRPLVGTVFPLPPRGPSAVSEHSDNWRVVRTSLTVHICTWEGRETPN
jgi:hypothetical protein